MNEAKSTLLVVCVLLEEDGKVLAARRSANMSLPLKWEFPGGKVEPGESLEQALRREIEEELSVQICIVESWSAECHPLPDGRDLELHPFLGRIKNGIPQSIEHEEIRWLSPENILDLDWAEADQVLVRKWKEKSRRSTDSPSRREFHTGIG
jgi:8-oxo-dGTP diphosphatase